MNENEMPAPPSVPESDYQSELGLHTQPGIVEAISSQVESVTDGQVAEVLKALHVIQHGDPLGTVLTNTETGEIALRVAVNGIHQWRVTRPDGSARTELGTTLPGWDVLRAVEPTA